MAKETEPPNESELPLIGDDDREFVRVLCMDGVGQTEAYKRSYPHELQRMGYVDGPAPSWLKVAAHRKAKDKAIRAWISAMRQWGQASSKCSMAEHMARLMELSEQALAAGNYAAAVNAEIARGKAAGLYVERTETTITTTDPQALFDQAKKMLGEEAAIRWAMLKGYDHLVQGIQH